MELAPEEEGFVLRSQLSKLQLVVKCLSQENSRLKQENERLAQHALPPPVCEQPRSNAGHLALPQPISRQPAYLAGETSTSGRPMGHAPPVHSLQDALEEIRTLQHRLEVLSGKLHEEEQPRFQHPQCCPPSPPGGGADFLYLVEELNGRRCRSPIPFQRSPNRQPMSPKPYHGSPNRPPRSPWRSPSAYPRSPYPPSPGYNAHRLALKHIGASGGHSPSAVHRRAGSRRLTSHKGHDSVVNGSKKSARTRSHQATTSARLHHGIPCKQWQ